MVDPTNDVDALASSVESFAQGRTEVVNLECQTKLSASDIRYGLKRCTRGGYFCSKKE